MADLLVKISEIVKTVPQGKVVTYKNVAELLGDTNYARIVGNVFSKNFDSSVPCHRVVRSDGFVGGYNRGIEKKVEKLRNEGVSIRMVKNKNGENYFVLDLSKYSFRLSLKLSE